MRVQRRERALLAEEVRKGFMKEQIIYELAFKPHVGLQQQIWWGEGIPEGLAWKKFWGSKT